MTTYGLRADAIVGYTFRADIYCPSCTLAAVKRAHLLDYPLASTIGPHDDAEDILRTVAKSLKLDHEDEHGFDSGVFPKVIFADQVEDDSERCGACGESLIA